MKKIRKAIWVPIVSVLAVIAIAVLVLSLVRVKPFEKNFGQYDYVYLLQTSENSQFPEQIDSKGENITEKGIKEGLAASDFSIMHAILEGTFSYGLTLQTKHNEETDEDEPDTINAANIKAYSAGSKQYLLRFHYNDIQTIEVDGKNIHYNRLLLRIEETDSEIKDMICIPYCDYCVNNESMLDKVDEDGHIGHIYYNAYIINIKMNTSTLMIKLGKLVND